ncbi:MAG: hypothetical protein FWD93_04635, partial [Coriobacteriia bacterium]|nr:hypothetical protein [Coriobacteriia bacterium]
MNSSTISRRSVVTFLVALMLASSFSGLFPATAEASAEERRAVARHAGNFYARASNSAEVVATFNTGRLIRHVAQHRNSETWMTARLDGERVFVRRADIAMLPRNNAPDQSERRAVVRNNHTATVYRHPSTHAREIGIINSSRLISNVQRFDRAGNWLRITYDGGTGFVQRANVVILPRSNAQDRSDRRAFVRRDSTIFRHPTTHARVVEEVSRHHQLRTVRNWDRAGNWVEVRQDGRRIGFIRNADVSFTAQRTARHTLRQRVTFTADTNHFRAA